MVLSISLEKLASQVKYGETIRVNCYLCGGYHSLSITKKDGHTLWHCFKAKCSATGRHPLILTHDELVSTVSKQHTARNALEPFLNVVSPFRLPTYWIEGIASKKCFQTLLNGNAWESYQKGLYRTAYDPRQDRLVFLVRNHAGTIVGAIGKSLSGQKPKVYNYPESANIPFMCGKGKTAVLVEDCLSACSIGRLEEYTGIALLGTEIKKEYLYTILLEFKEIVVALDKDALHKSLKVRNIVNQYRDNTKIWKLNKDLKELDKASLIEFVLSTSNNKIII